MEDPASTHLLTQFQEINRMPLEMKNVILQEENAVDFDAAEVLVMNRCFNSTDKGTHGLFIAARGTADFLSDEEKELLAGDKPKGGHFSIPVKLVAPDNIIGSEFALRRRRTNKDLSVTYTISGRGYNQLIRRCHLEPGNHVKLFAARIQGRLVLAMMRFIPPVVAANMNPPAVAHDAKRGGSGSPPMGKGNNPRAQKSQTRRRIRE